ncbi:hypothetical protein [Sphingorhabdus sp.]|uniref:hypothetical protein n=1 Tax=Sphingorhabdus sp. TaxID=1902408 RepID=UPI003D815A69
MIRDHGVQTLNINTVIDELLGMKEAMATSSIGREIIDVIRIREQLGNSDRQLNFAQ